MNAMIDVHEVQRRYLVGETEVHALRGVSFQVNAGEFVALMGTSGSGKTTLLHILGCLDTPSAGAYRLEGRDVSRLSDREKAHVRNGRIGFIFQTFNLLPRLTALHNVALPLLYRPNRANALERAAAALERVGLAERLDHRPNQLSGGQRQRVAIARALVVEPAILLADEPTGNLDSRTGTEILDLLVRLANEGRTIVMVTHDPAVAAHAHQTLHMRDGKFIG